MFTLVVFTLVTGTVTSGRSSTRPATWSASAAGSTCRASTAGVAPIDDLPAAIRREPSLDAGDYPVAASQSFLPLEAASSGPAARRRPIPCAAWTTPSSGRRPSRSGRGREGTPRTRTSGGPWRGGLDWPSSTTVVPRRDNFGFSAVPADFRLSGFLLEDPGFEPVPVEVADPRTGGRLRLTVIGVLSDAAPLR